MYSIAKLSNADRKDLFDTYSFQFNKRPEIVEKDFWVTLLLDNLFHKSEFKDYFTFKGGTSLSKCFGIIDRFSEDIDLILNWNALGFTDEDIYSSRSNNAQLKYNKSIEDMAMVFIETKLKPSMTFDFKNILGKDPIFELGDDKHVLNFFYPNIYNAESTGILQCVRLEIGPLAERVPSVDKEITPFISEMNLPHMTKFSTVVRCISPERTFWEIVLILHQEAHRPMFKKDKNGRDIPNLIPKRYSRHYYDVWKISQTEYKNIAMTNLDLLNRVIAFKKKFYHYSWDDLENAKPGSIILVPNDERITELRQDFSSMREMLNDDSIHTFDELIQHLSSLENELNTK